MKSNIVLIGFMGTGKSTVGKILAEKLSKDFIEMDDIISQKANKSIPEIFSQDGEITFRELEMQVAKELSEKKNKIISAGGGLVLNKLNIDYLKKKSILVLLRANPKEIFKRISKDGKEKRPLLDNIDPVKEIKSLLDFRLNYYNSAAEITISTDNKDPSQIASEIIRKLKTEEPDKKK